MTVQNKKEKKIRIKSLYTYFCENMYWFQYS